MNIQQLLSQIDARDKQAEQQRKAEEIGGGQPQGQEQGPPGQPQPGQPGGSPAEIAQAGIDNSRRQEPKDDAESQAIYERVVLAGSQLIYGDDSAEGVKNMLQGGMSNPEQVLAQVAGFIIQQIDEKSGYTLPAEVIFPAAGEILAELALFASKTKLFEVDEAGVNRAFIGMLRDLSDAYGVSQEEIEEYLSEYSPEEIQSAVSTASNYYPEFQKGGQPQKQPMEGAQ